MEPAGPAPDGPAAGGSGWVLVCDDTVSIRLLIRINLELAGFEVLEAADGEAALALLRRHRDLLPAVLILDAQMRPMDGWDAIAEIRADPDLRDLPVVMVTAALQQHEQERSVAAGVDAFVAKPFEPEPFLPLSTSLAVSAPPPPPP
jgi:CheY-like chemotaxis protein